MTISGCQINPTLPAFDSNQPSVTPVPVIERTPVKPAPTSTETASLPDPDPASLPPTPTQIQEQEISPTTAAEQKQENTPTATATVKTQSAQSSPLLPSTEEILAQAILPDRDQRLLAIRLKNGGQDIPKTTAKTPTFQLGDTDTFWVTDNQQKPPQQLQVEATLKYMTDHAYWWVGEGHTINEEALKRSGDRFENETYPTNREFFGSEWSPGVDHDQRVHIFLGTTPGVAGYFSASNSYSKLAEPYSNEREMFFLNLNALSPGNNYFDGVLAHEFQHMIHWNQDRNEDTWVNEGLSELATFINGLGSSNFVGAFVNTPDTQLTGWSDAPGGTLPHYGGSYLFMAYFLQRFGEDVMRDVVANPHNGVAGFDTTLAEYGYDERFNDIFGDYLVANYLQNPTLQDGLWGYTDLPPTSAVTLSERYSVYPTKQQNTVYQYGGDYIELSGSGNLALEFTGSTRVKVIDNQPHSGEYQWYSHRGDESNTHLTHAFDLSQVETATLNYWTWYDIETDWDYAYVEISTNEGTSWTILPAPHSVTSNPSGNAFGPGYTGPSNGGPSWVQESIDLSAYTGQEVLIRFEYVTDAAVNGEGLLLDDIAIPEIGYFNDFESDTADWDAAGFVRIQNILPQTYRLALISKGSETTVKYIALSPDNSAEIPISIGGAVEEVIVIVTGTTRYTRQPAAYRFEFLP